MEKGSFLNQTNWKNMLICLCRMFHFVINHYLLLLQYPKYLNVLCIQKCHYYNNNYYYY